MRRSSWRGLWLGLALLWACLNPQPDTDPLVTGSETAPPVDVAPPQPSAGGVTGNDSIEDGEPAQSPSGLPQDAGPPPAEADAGSGGPISVTLSVQDAGALSEPDAGPPSSDDQ